jgi:hypothetical protein
VLKTLDLRKEFWILGIPAVLYLLNQLWLQDFYGGTFLRGYCNDFLAPIIFLALVDLYRRFLRIPEIKHQRLFYLAIVLVAGLTWEFVSPLWRTNSVTDYYDFIAYVCGYSAYCFLSCSKSGNMKKGAK